MSTNIPSLTKRKLLLIKTNATQYMYKIGLYGKINYGEQIWVDF